MYMRTAIDIASQSADGAAPAVDPVTQKEAFALGRRLQELAASQAGLDHDFCVLVDQFDAADAVRWFDGIRSTAHYIAWACSMEGGAARGAGAARDAAREGVAARGPVVVLEGP